MNHIKMMTKFRKLFSVLIFMAIVAVSTAQLSQQPFDTEIYHVDEPYLMYFNKDETLALTFDNFRLITWDLNNLSPLTVYYQPDQKDGYGIERMEGLGNNPVKLRGPLFRPVLSGDGQYVAINYEDYGTNQVWSDVYSGNQLVSFSKDRVIFGFTPDNDIICGQMDLDRDKGHQVSGLSIRNVKDEIVKALDIKTKALHFKGLPEGSAILSDDARFLMFLNTKKEGEIAVVDFEQGSFEIITPGEKWSVYAIKNEVVIGSTNFGREFFKYSLTDKTKRNFTAGWKGKADIVFSNYCTLFNVNNDNKAHTIEIFDLVQEKLVTAMPREFPEYYYSLNADRLVYAPRHNQLYFIKDFSITMGKTGSGYRYDLNSGEYFWLPFSRNPEKMKADAVAKDAEQNRIDPNYSNFKAKFKALTFPYVFNYASFEFADISNDPVIRDQFYPQADDKFMALGRVEDCSSYDVLLMMAQKGSGQTFNVNFFLMRVGPNSNTFIVETFGSTQKVNGNMTLLTNFSIKHGDGSGNHSRNAIYLEGNTLNQNNTLINSFRYEINLCNFFKK